MSRSGTPSRPRCSRATSRVRAPERRMSLSTNRRAPSDRVRGHARRDVRDRLDLSCRAATLPRRCKRHRARYIGEETIMNRSVLGLSLAGGFGVASCTGASAADYFPLSSPAFKDGTLMAQKNAGAVKGNANCVGENVSPPLAWANPPAGTKSYALLMIDP